MSLLVDNITYDQAVRAIREIVLDVNPVPAFKVSGQDFAFSKNAVNVVIENASHGIDTTVPKIYDLIKLLRAAEVTIEFLPDYVSTEYTKGLTNFAFESIMQEKTIVMDSYFSDDTIEAIMLEFYEQFLPYNGRSGYVQGIFTGLGYTMRRRMLYWVAYWLIDRRRMNAATAEQIISLQGGSTGNDYKQTVQEVTTTVGDVFRVTERVEENNGTGEDSFTSFWGDRYGYYAKLQLWLRDRYEKMFGDMSLRDGTLRVTTFTIDKNWAPYSYNRPGLVRDIFLPENL